MSRNVVRGSKFRHVFGTPSRNDACYTALHLTEKNLESDLCAVNPKFFAYINHTRGGGSVTILENGKYGRLPTEHPVIQAHGETITDIAFNPFNDNMLATASEDGSVKLWEIPEGGLVTNLSESLGTFTGHKKKVVLLKWNPSVEGILLSAAADGTVIIWNLTQGKKHVCENISTGNICSVAWNYDGSQFAFTDKHDNFKIVDPRKNEVVRESEEFKKLFKTGKSSRCEYVSDNRIVVFGFNQSAVRIYALYKVNDLNDTLTTANDTGSIGQMQIYYDEDTSILFKCARGEAQISYYEIDNNAPYVHWLSTYSPTASSGAGQRGGSWLPKRGVNPRKCEIARYYKVTADKCEPISFTVPRKSDLFQDDIFPDFRTDQPAVTAEAWEDGKSAEPCRGPWEPIYEAFKNNTAAPVGTQVAMKPIKISGISNKPSAPAENGVALPPGVNITDLLDDIKKLKATVRKNNKRITKLEKQLGEAMMDGDAQQEEEEEEE